LARSQISYKKEVKLMAIKGFNPITPARRQMTVSTFEEITTNEPYKALLAVKKRSGGRNANGKITVRHIGGGAKQKYRIIDFKRNKDGIKAKVATIEYDPNRTAFIALVVYADGEKRYIISPGGLKVGDIIESGEKADIKPGNCLPIKYIPVGTIIHNIELSAGKGAQLVRSAGNSAQLMAKEGEYSQVRLPSGEVRYIRMECKACIGTVSNSTNEIVNLGSAGRKRHMGVRPTVRGAAMNPNDHPHGGGEGKAPVGHPGPMTPWGKPALGYKTRKHKKYSNRFIVKGRNDK